MIAAFNFLLELDPNFRLIWDLYGQPNIPHRPPGFETLCKIIFEQQVSLESGKACYDKLSAMLPAFTPQNVLAASEADFRACGLSRQKATYITALADAIVSGQLDVAGLEHKSPEEARHELTKIKGIGNWTADVYLMFSLGAPDIIPLSDIGIAVTIRELWNIEDREEAKKLTENWSPYRSAASFFLWHYYLRKRGRIIHM